jgi:hypothetical protein
MTKKSIFRNKKTHFLAKNIQKIAIFGKIVIFDDFLLIIDPPLLATPLFLIFFDILFHL